MLFILLTALLSTPECMAWNEDRRVVCSGKDFRVPVFSRSRIVTFTPSSPPGPKRVLLENNTVKDPRYEWTRDQTLLVKEVTHRDQGVYAVKFSHGFTIETVELIVSECIRKFHKNYGETFRLDIPPDGALLELNPLNPLSFPPTPTPSPPPSPSPSRSPSLPLSLSPPLPPSLSPTSSQTLSLLSSSSPSSSPTTPTPSLSSSSPPLPPHSPTLPLVLWPPSGSTHGAWGRGRMEGRSWVLDGVTPMDQGNYTVKDSSGKVVLRASLAVAAHWSNRTLFLKESLFIRLYAPLTEAKLRLTPAPSSFSSSSFSPSSRSPSVLLRDGQIVEEGVWQSGRLSVEWNSTATYFVVAALGEKDSGTYEVRDAQGNLVSTDIVRVVHKHMRWRAVIKSISVPSGMFASLAGFILFLKRYRSSKSTMRSGMRERRDATTVSVPPTIHIEDYSEPSLTQYTSSPYKVRTSQQRSSSPSHSVGSPVVQRVQTHTDSPEPARSREQLDTGPNQSLLSEAPEGVRKTSFSLSGASDCLHSSDHCAQFEIVRDSRKDAGRMDYFYTLPLDTDASTICSVYTSDKLNMR
ncbi:hypothetical protein ACEWY4_015170 [Coilia grayii]|uniref:Uncharacterized protein n=1 Tax=Coilia grayii TaxID=363190 RepID=A0ABD1JMA1_9TELE